MRKRKIAAYLLGMLLALACFYPFSCSGEKIQLRVYNAASLIIPLQALEKEFEAKYPAIDVMLDGHGSIQVIRSVTELKQEVDVAAVADSQLVPLLMYPSLMPENNLPYADWCVDFASNSLGIAFTEKSRYSSDINSENWYEIMSRPDVRIGFSDPRIDSLGYRALMAVKLAEDYYSDPTIFESMINSDLTIGMQIGEEDGVTLITVPKLFKPAQQRVIIRSYSIQILALLQSGDVDYAFEYESVTRQHKLQYLEIPDDFNLSAAEKAGDYAKIRVRLDFQRFASVDPEFTAAPIVYGITVPANSKHKKEASLFLQYLLGPEGREIFQNNYQPPLFPPAADRPESVPPEIRNMLK